MHGNHLSLLLREGLLVGCEEQALLVAAHLIMCKGFPPVPVMRWLLTWVLENMPERVAERLHPRPKGARPEDVIGMFWDPPEKQLMDQWTNLGQLPPAYAMFGCGDWEEMETLPLTELWRRCIVEGAWRPGAKKLERLALAHRETGQRKSVSRDKQESLSKMEENQQRLGEQVYRGEREAHVEVPFDDPTSTRFIAQVEHTDELDRLISRVKLSPAERIVLAGRRKGLEGEALIYYVGKHPQGGGISRASIPVLASKALSKLRAAAKG